MSTCTKCETSGVEVFCVNDPPREGDLIMCGRCWMVRAFNEGLSLNSARRELAARTYPEGAKNVSAASIAEALIKFRACSQRDQKQRAADLAYELLDEVERMVGALGGAK